MHPMPSHTKLNSTIWPQAIPDLFSQVTSLAMAIGNCVIVHNTAENLETISEAGLSYDGKVGAGSLREVLMRLLNRHDQIAGYRRQAFEYARSHYRWDSVTDAYERLFYQVLKRPLPERLRAESSCEDRSMASTD